MFTKFLNQPVIFIFGLAGVFTVAAGIDTHVAGNPIGMTLGISLAFIALGALSARVQGTFAEMGAAAALIGQAIALTTAFQGHSWQLDSHMLFFALMATLVVLVDVRALIAAATLVVVHHLSLAVAFPALIYPDAGLVQNVARTLMDGASDT